MVELSQDFHEDFPEYWDLVSLDLASMREQVRELYDEEPELAERLETVLPLLEKIQNHDDIRTEFRSDVHYDGRFVPSQLLVPTFPDLQLIDEIGGDGVDLLFSKEKSTYRDRLQQ